MKTKKKNNRGFSLIELIIAVAILVVLSGLLAPQLIKYVERSREARDMQTLDSVYVAVNSSLIDEEAYKDLVENEDSAYRSIETGMEADELISGDGAFANEISSLLGKEVKIELFSKETREANIYIRVLVDDDDKTNVDVGVYIGSDATSRIGNFGVGNVPDKKDD